MFIVLGAFQQRQTQYFKNCMSVCPLWEDKSACVTSVSLQAQLLSVL